MRICRAGLSFKDPGLHYVLRARLFIRFSLLIFLPLVFRSNSCSLISMSANLCSLSRLTSVITEHNQASGQSCGRYCCGQIFAYSRPYSLKCLKLESTFPVLLSFIGHLLRIVLSSSHPRVGFLDPNLPILQEG